MWYGSSRSINTFKKNCISSVVKGDVGDGKLSLSQQDVSGLTGQDGSLETLFLTLQILMKLMI